MIGLPGAAANLAGGSGFLERNTGGNGDLKGAAFGVAGAFANRLAVDALEPVSYTHLTLPTKA